MKINFDELMIKYGGRNKLCLNLNLSPGAISLWTVRGIPVKHWPHLIKQAKISYEDLKDLNDRLMARK